MFSTQDPRSLGHHQSIRGTPEFFAYLATDAGLQTLSTVELGFYADIRVENDEIFVHPAHLLPEVERELKNHWHDYEFNRTMRMKLLSERSQSWLLHLPIPIAAAVQFNRAMIIRDARLVDLVVDQSGEVMAFGCVDGLTMAREIIDRMTYAALASNSYTGQFNDTATLMRSDSNMNMLRDVAYPVTASLFPTPLRFEGGAEPSVSTQSVTQPETRAAKKERLTFLVKSTDAPQLIGSKGINKRKIEDSTQCHITLHTESKQNGEFPVEVTGWTMEKCLAARDYIKTFLAEENKAEEAKKAKFRPKVHLEMSPRRTIVRGK